MRTGGELTFDFASDADWPAIWRVFREVVRAGDTYTYPPEMSEEAARAMWMPDAATGRVTYVARLDGEVVGTAFLRANGPVGGPSDHVANAGWMVARSASGRGVGRKFAEFVIEDARRRGYLAMQFNAVVECNERAVALWLSLGFEIVGTVPEAFRHPGRGLVGLHVMYRRL